MSKYLSCLWFTQTKAQRVLADHAHNISKSDGSLDYAEGPDERELRAELRSLIDENLPHRFLGAFTDNPEDLKTAQRFCKVLADRQLLTLAWQKSVGGGGGTVWQQAVLREEMWAHHEPRGAQYMGLNWVGPAIMRFGTPQQQSEQLTRIARGDVIWCQGFSEPDSGTDLASLSTGADADGRGWRIHGQKIWTSYATMADWCFLLARTSRDSDKHHGITVFVIPMDQPGIEVRPIASMLGPHHLNEVFFDDAWAGPDSVRWVVWAMVGASCRMHSGPGEASIPPVLCEGARVHCGLAFERVGIARYARSERLLNLAPLVLSDRWEDLPVALKQRWVRCLVHARQARLLA